MVSTTPFFASVLSLLLAACAEPGTDYGFRILDVKVNAGYQKLSAQYQQRLTLSRSAIEALQSGIPLTLRLEMELRDSLTLTLLADDALHFEIRYLPLVQRYQLTGPDSGNAQSFPRLRHVMNRLASLSLDFPTGPLAPGHYEFRSRIRLENSRLPAPMQLPAMFSADWQHDSEWITWPFEINA